MALRETTHTADTDLFRQELANIINLRHPLVQLTQKIDWRSCESRFGDLYAAGVGRPGHPIRLMVGLQLLKHTCNVSDEEVVATCVENPYWQYFCGEQYFCHALPIDPSLMTGFRKRIGEAGCEFILGLTLSAGLATKTVCAEFSDPAVADTAENIMKSLGKMPIRVGKDIPGFVANRLQHALVREALWMVANGVASPEAVDTAVRYGFGLRLRFLACGPMMQKEMSGWDTNYQSGSMIYPSLCNAPSRRTCSRTWWQEATPA